MEMVLGMLFLNFSNIDVQFAEKELTWRTYSTKRALPTTRQVKIINWKEFAKAALDENIEAFVVHVSSLRLRMNIHPARKAQLALLLIKKVTVPVEYSDFADVFLEKSANVHPERTWANEHAIEVEEGKQPPYGHIYSLGPVELKTFKTYTSWSTWQIVLSGHQSYQRVLRYCLSASSMGAFAYVSITKDSIILRSQISIYCRWLASPWIDLVEQNNSPRLTSRVFTIGWG